MLILRLLYRHWMRFANFIGKINSIIILSILWTVVVGTYAIILKLIQLFSKDKPRDTFWQEKKYYPPEIKTVERQF